MKEWITCQLGDLITFQRGHDLSKTQMCGGEYPVVGSNGIIGYHNEYTTEEPSITIGRSGNVGKPFLYKGKSWSHNTSLYIKEFKGVDPIFIYYFLQTLDLGNYAGGSAVPTLNRNHIHTLEVNVPSDIHVQYQIASILSVLDNKIENNKAINQNLVQQLELIYNEMYPYDTDAIPDGWRSVHLGDVCESISVKHDFKKDELIFLNTGDIENGCFLHSNYSAVESMPGQAKKTIKKDDILYSEIRPINRHYAYVSFNAEDYVVSTKLMVIRAKGIDSRRLYHYLTSKSVIDELQHEAEARSGTFPQIRFDNIQRLKMIIAPPEQEKAFCEILHAYYRKIDANIAENERLSLLRDSILPKLMSGELDVS